jgi:hypothetical protein
MSLRFKVISLKFSAVRELFGVQPLGCPGWEHAKAWIPNKRGFTLARKNPFSDRLSREDQSLVRTQSCVRN